VTLGKSKNNSLL